MYRKISHATAELRGGRGYPELHGTVRFRQLRAGVLVTAEVFGLPAGDASDCGIFAFHIHEGGSCAGDGGKPFPNAGGHYNPGNRLHPCHAGDLPPLFGNNGYAYLSVFTDRFTVEEVIGRVAIVHRNPDDFITQPSGNPGPMIACGEILAR